MLGIGLECGSDILMPSCKCRNKTPASILAPAEKGGVLTSPCNHTKGLRCLLTALSICQNWHTHKARSSKGWPYCFYCRYLLPSFRRTPIAVSQSSKKHLNYMCFFKHAVFESRKNPSPNRADIVAAHCFHGALYFSTFK